MGGELMCHHLWWSNAVLLRQVHLYMYANLLHNCGGVRRPRHPKLVSQGLCQPPHSSMIRNGVPSLPLSVSVSHADLVAR